MGLDMYAYKVNKNILTDADQVDFSDKLVTRKLGCNTDTEFAYWRKFNALHGWMEDLYHKKGGTKEFNCVPVRLTLEDLNNLESDIKVGLNGREGFFFGMVRYFDSDDQESVQNFITKARKELSKGYAIVYMSWW